MCSPRTMPRNKERLYLALYNRPPGYTPVLPDREDKYHWAFLLCPKQENKSSQGTKCHVKDVITIDETKDKDNKQKSFQFEEREVWLTAVDMIVARLVIGKVLDRDRLLNVLRGTRVKKHGDAGGWSSVNWAQDVLLSLTREDGILGASVIDWETVRTSALWYVAEKTAQHRFDGKAIGTFDRTKVPTWDLVNDVELEP